MKNVETIDSQKHVIEKPDQTTVTMNGEDKAGFKRIIGTENQELALHLMTQLANVTVQKREEDPIKTLDLGIILQHAIQPKDELEALLAAQMVGVHNLAMKFMAIANIPGQTFEGVDASVERATKMLRTFTAQMEALNRYRGKGQQKVTVEHVTVNQGGQAVIGNVERQGGGGDGQK